MDFTTGLTIGLILGGVGGVAVGFYFFARAVAVSDSDTEKEIIQEPNNAPETKEPENISRNRTQKYSCTKRRRKKGITGRSKKRKRGG